MNDTTTEDYLRKIIGGKLFTGNRLPVWDAFARHKSEGNEMKGTKETKALLKELGIEAAYIPGGCTKFIQAPDVSWNKPFKGRIRDYYNIWFNNGAQREWTANGNARAPSLEFVLEWVERAWRELSKEVIIKSFKACALTTATDGSEDDRITCFKPDGSIGPRGLDILRGVRAQEMAQDGQHDYEEAGISEDEEEVVLENVNENEELYFN